MNTFIQWQSRFSALILSACFFSIRATCSETRVPAPSLVNCVESNLKSSLPAATTAPRQSVVVNVLDRGLPLDPPSIGRLYQATLDRSEPLLRDFTLPPSFLIKMSKFITSSEVLWTGDKVDAMLIQTPALKTGMTQLDELSSVLLWHEYGHIVFMKNADNYMAEAEASWKAFTASESYREQLAKLQAEQQVATARMRSLNLKLAASPAPDQAPFRTSSEYVSTAQRMAEINRQIRFATEPFSWDKYFTLSYPYQELFADIIPVLLTKDGTIVQKALANELAGTGSPKLIGRDFEEALDPRNWTNDGNHELFGPVRSFLWKQYLSNPKNYPVFPIMLRKIYEGIQQDIVSRFQSIESDSVSEMNTRLITRLSNELKAFQ